MVSELRVRTAPTSQLSPADLDELRALLDAAFAGRFSDDDWAHAVGGVHVIASVDGEVAGHGSVVVRELTAGDTTLRTGYVEAVATAVARRRLGVASAVMTEVERLVTAGFDLGALSSSRQAVRMYAGRGWQRWTGPVAATTPEGVVDSPGEAVFVLPTQATPPGLDTTGPLVCDWRSGDPW